MFIFAATPTLSSVCVCVCGGGRGVVLTSHLTFSTTKLFHRYMGVWAGWLVN